MAKGCGVALCGGVHLENHGHFASTQPVKQIKIHSFFYKLSWLV